MAGASTETDITVLRNRPGRVELDITNEGEAADIEAVVELYDEDGAAIASRTCNMGRINPGATKVMNTDIFVPADADGASTTIRVSDPGRTAAEA